MYGGLQALDQYSMSPTTKFRTLAAASDRILAGIFDARNSARLLMAFRTWTARSTCRLHAARLRGLGARLGAIGGLMRRSDCLCDWSSRACAGRELS